MTSRNVNHSGLGLARQPGAIYFGPDTRLSLPAIAAPMGRSALLCTDQRMARSEDFQKLRSALNSSGISTTVFSDVSADLPRTDVETLIAEVGNIRFDVVIGIGGGSCLDMAKIAAVMLTHGGRVSDYYGEFKVPGPTLPIITVPTTGGTGAEATCIAVISDPDLEMKVGVASPFLEPAAAVVDPVLTLSCPPGLTASTGADALSHLVEAFTATAKNPASGALTEHVYVGKNLLTDSYCRVGLALLGRSLQVAWSEPENLLARSETMLAALNAGLAINSTGTAAAHAIQSPIGTITHTSHGFGVGALLPYVMRFNLPVRVPEFAEIGRILGAAEPADSEENQARAGIERIEDIFATLGIPATLAELGLPKSSLRTVAEHSMLATRLIANNPRQLDAESIELILEKAHSGDRSWWS